MSRKSPSCKARKTGRPLSEYDNRRAAQEAATYASKAYRGPRLVPYKCESCGFWHLSPEDRQTPSTTCTHCRGSDGKLKEAYPTEELARQRAKLLKKEQGVQLKVYLCDYGSGWHLTKSLV